MLVLEFLDQPHKLLQFKLQQSQPMLSMALALIQFMGVNLMIEINHNVLTGEITEIELTSQQVKEIEKEAKIAQAKYAMEIAESQAKATARQAIADRLGLTADELKVLLG